MTRSWLAWASGLAVALLAVGFPAGGTVPVAEAASGRAGACTTADNNAVTVVIDYQGLGGGTATYCASNLSPGATGLDALTAAGVSVTGTTQIGGVVCRLNGRPGPGETLSLPGGQDYQEQCVTMPPAGAYWSSWWANPGGSWTYATQGALAQSAHFGGYEGWSFALGGGIGQAPPPRPAPAPLAVPPPIATTPPPSPPPAPSTQPAQPAQPAPPAATTPVTAPGGDQTATTPPDTGVAQPVTATDLPAATTTSDPAAAPVTVGWPTGTSSSGDASPAGTSGSTPWGTITGLTLVALLAAAGVIGWFRRQNGQRD